MALWIPGLRSDWLSPAEAHPGMTNGGDNSHRIGFMESRVQAMHNASPFYLSVFYGNVHERNAISWPKRGCGSKH
jgi:hypothetical protein